MLKSGADIATGIATIASTVLGVCAAISAVLLAITIFGWMFPSPITVPSMTWLGTVMSISGYTAMISGVLSFRLNQLMYQHNLHQAASATTAREFLGNALEMKENVVDGATGLMSIAAGYGGVKMGPGFNMKNVVKGFRTPKRTLNTMKNAWQGVKGIPKHLAGKGKKLLTNILSGGKEMFKGLRDRIKALFGKKKKTDLINNQGVLDGDGAPSVNDRTPDRVEDGTHDTNSDGQNSSDNDVVNDEKKNDGNSEVDSEEKGNLEGEKIEGDKVDGADSEKVDKLSDDLDKSPEFAESAFDDKGKLQPNTTFRSGEFGYIGETDDLGRLSRTRTDNLRLSGEDRLRHNPNTPGKLDGDHAGHLLGDRFGGSPELDNLVSQHSKVNLSEFKVIENQWAKDILSGKKLEVDIVVHYNGSELRPASFEVHWAVDGDPFSV